MSASERRTWTARLKASGFDDIETASGDLKRDQVQCPDGERHPELEGRDQYFSLARRYLQLVPIPDALDRRIWELHCDGLSYREIEREANTYTKRVHGTVNRLRAHMLDAVKPSNPGKSSNGNDYTQVMEADPKLMLTTAMAIMHEQLSELQKHSNKRLLEKTEADSLCNYAKVLLAAAKSERDEDDDDLSDYTPEQLRERVNKLMGRAL